MAPEAGRITTRVDGRIGWLIFDNAARRNAMSLDMWTQAADALEDFDRNEAIRVVVMRGAGGKAFVSGGDISQYGANRDNPEQAAAYAARIDWARDRMSAFAKPMIAMIEGYCLGGGVRIALMADIRVASDASIFGIPAARLGLGYGFESVTKLIETIGAAATRDLLFSARRINAREAQAIGLITQAAPLADLERTVQNLASSIASNAPLTIRAAKIAIAEALRSPAERNMSAVAASIEDCFASADYRIGREAFLEKRSPEFTGR